MAFQKEIVPEGHYLRCPAQPSQRLSKEICLSESRGQKKGTPKNSCDKDFAELLAELSGVICLKTLVLLGSDLEFFSKC